MMSWASTVKDSVLRVKLPLLSGVLIGTSYIPFPPWASLFCFVPLWIFWSRQSRLTDVLLGGFACAFIFTLIGFNWVTFTLHEFAHLDWWVSVIGMGLFAILAHLFVPVAGAVWFFLSSRIARTSWHSRWIMALVTILSQATVPTLFDWNFGYAWFASKVPIFHCAEIIGFSGLSALTLLAGLMSWAYWDARRKPKGRRILVAGLALFLGFNSTGLWLAASIPAPDSLLRVLMVQGNIGNSEKMAAELGNGYQDGILKTYMDLTEKGLAAEDGRSIDFAIWPETAFPDFLGKDIKTSPRRERLESFLKSHHLALATGAYGFDFDSGKLTNSLFLLDREGKLVSPHYSKTILLAFGEYLPGEEWFPSIREWLPPIGQFARGAGPTQLIAWNSHQMGVQICYESLFPDFTRKWADLGAQYLVNVTNDSWYGTWEEPRQHLMMTLGRAVEVRRPVLRTTNTGISTVGLASGQVMSESPLHEAWTGIYEIPYRKHPEPTLYQETFWLVPFLLWAGLVQLTLAGWRVKKRA
jgi:apolipoprotein N-acyltransferase